MVRKSNDFYAEREEVYGIDFHALRNSSQQSNSERKELFLLEIKLSIKTKGLIDS